jgi:hypothetical protein
MLERLGLLEHDLATVMSILDELVEIMDDNGLWLEGSEADGFARCIVCGVEWWEDDGDKLDAAYWRAFWRGEYEFPHDDGCGYDAALRWTGREYADAHE